MSFVMQFAGLFQQAQQPTPDTNAYMYAGYAVILIVILIYLVSLAVRSRNLKQDFETLQELEQAPEKGRPASGSNTVRKEPEARQG